jgi:hypothetical protein
MTNTFIGVAPRVQDADVTPRYSAKRSDRKRENRACAERLLDYSPDRVHAHVCVEYMRGIGKMTRRTEERETAEHELFERAPTFTPFPQFSARFALLPAYRSSRNLFPLHSHWTHCNSRCIYTYVHINLLNRPRECCCSRLHFFFFIFLFSLSFFVAFLHFFYTIFSPSIHKYSWPEQLYFLNYQCIRNNPPLPLCSLYMHGKYFV